MNPCLAVSARHISHQFAGFSALNDVSFEVKRGQTMALLGHNGAGKSTLIKILLGLLKPSEGEVIVLGKNHSELKQRNELRIGYLPENVSFYDKLTGKEILSYFAALKRVTKPRVSQLIEEFGLEYAQDRALKTYSKGMKQRLGFAQAILCEPELLLLDEPTVGLDPVASQFLYGKIDELKQQGCGVIVCTHELSLIENNIDIALILAKGESLAKGSLAELRQNSGLKTRLTAPNLASWVAQEPRLAAYYADDALQLDAESKSQVLQLVMSECQVFDFSLTQPALAEIYHFYMSQNKQTQAVS
ncbi:ABC transporter ATP-binding protein [Shewanella schlegeliana]|uniref:ABC transporter ATP-binding protein n=1 Tax=Shewanella schlegeliana TaxID=190308 RepID=A0ABS1T261_9GAMM|nr:ABC transporter ATP-binding protein [Shewanella schlegeliana]MBL4914887.1 ABC transporter ATP-binding protein [Shewanella schlegeliana]MCL1110422.1 ABC transporter ATP-binding protein [Shewanella schlegeliana]GIU27737.1 ABC copper transporter ATPase NosF [Shewanella schlegeliana]